MGTPLKPVKEKNETQEDEDDEEEEEEEEEAKPSTGPVRAPLIPKYSGKIATPAPLNKAPSRTAVVPTWEPASSFSYPIAKVPVKYAIYDNLTFNSFKDVRHIADGSNANIFMGMLGNEQVIIKMIKEFMEKDPLAIQEFDLEYGTLSRVDHKNIIRVLGAGKIPRRFIVLEYLGGGSLNTLLAQNQQVSGNKLQKLFHKPTFTYASLLSTAKSIAQAMHYLHEQCHEGATIIHRGKKAIYPRSWLLSLTNQGCVRLKA